MTAHKVQRAFPHVYRDNFESGDAIIENGDFSPLIYGDSNVAVQDEYVVSFYPHGCWAVPRQGRVLPRMRDDAEW